MTDLMPRGYLQKAELPELLAMAKRLDCDPQSQDWLYRVLIPYIRRRQQLQPTAFVLAEATWHPSHLMAGRKALLVGFAKGGHPVVLWEHRRPRDLVLKTPLVAHSTTMVMARMSLSVDPVDPVEEHVYLQTISRVASPGPRYLPLKMTATVGYARGAQRWLRYGVCREATWNADGT